MLGFLGVEATQENYNHFARKFKCQRCKPSCCECALFKTGAIIYPDEIDRLAELAKLSKKQFKKLHTYTENGKRLMKLPCLFYKDGCSIHSSKPQVCREFPLNQAHHKNGKHWMTVNMSCPGGKELGDKYAVRVQV